MQSFFSTNVYPIVGEWRHMTPHIRANIGSGNGLLPGDNNLVITWINVDLFIIKGILWHSTPSNFARSADERNP